MSKITSAADWILKLPLIWGAFACLCFYGLLGATEHELLSRYFGSGAPMDLGTTIKVVTTAMFFIGAASLVMRLMGLAGQFGVLRQPIIDRKAIGGQPVEDAALLQTQLDARPSYLKRTYLVRRLRDAIEHVRRKMSAETLDEELRRLEEVDYARMSSGYSLVRIVVWAIPILGFLGTVIGITMAIAKLSPEQLEQSLDQVTSGLGVAFDTTALALALSMVLMFAKYFVERIEEQLLAAVDERANEELVGRFHVYGAGTDPYVASTHRMCEEVVQSVDAMAARQAELWTEAINETHRHWAQTTTGAGALLKQSIAEGLRESLQDHATGLTQGVETQLASLNASLQQQVLSFGQGIEAQTASLGQRVEAHGETLDQSAHSLMRNLGEGLERMAELLVEALQKHGETLTHAEEELASENRKHLSEVEAALGESMVLSADRQEKLIGRSEQTLREMQSALANATEASLAHQEQLVKQGEVLLKVIDATGQVKQLEESLSQNLNALGKTHNFEETLLSLSAAIQLLSARVGGPSERVGHAA